MKPIQALCWVKKAINNSLHGQESNHPTHAPVNGSPPQRIPRAAAAGIISPPSDPDLYNMSWTVPGHTGTGVVVDHTDTPLTSIPKCFLLMAAWQQCCILMVMSCEVPEETGGLTSPLWWILHLEHLPFPVLCPFCCTASSWLPLHQAPSPIITTNSIH